METKAKDDEIEINLGELLFVLWKKKWIILAVTLVGAIIGFLISSFAIAPTYKSTTKVYILNQQNENAVTFSDLQLGTQLTKDYAELIKSRYVLEEVIATSGLDNMTYKTLNNKLEVTTPPDTRILAITVTDTSKDRAMELANSIREVASEHIKNVMNIEAVNIVEEANYPEVKVGPSVTKWTLIAGIIFFMIVAGIIVLIHMLNDTIKTTDDVEKYLGLSTLASIPIYESDIDINVVHKVKRAKS